MKRNDLFVATGMIAVVAGTMVALASPAPTPTRRPLNPGIDVSISCIGAQTNGSKAIAFRNPGTAGMPAGMFGFVANTTSCNQQPDNGPPTARFGSGQPGIVANSPYWMGDWYAAWDTGIDWDGNNLGANAGNRHPYISLAVYSIDAQGRLTQLGTSWAKHSWLAASGSQNAVAGANGQDRCGAASCIDLSGGDQLEANCADTYDTGHNADSYWMGPRSEINPHKGYNDPGWTRWNSYLDNYTSSDVLAAAASRNDGNRSQTGNTMAYWKTARVGMDEVGQTALGPNGRVILEGYYVVNGDGYKLNNVAHRRFTSSVADGATTVATSSLNFAGPHTWGPAVLQWGEQKSQGEPSVDGQVFVCSRAVDLGGGQWRYEYNVYNLDLDRRVASFEVPIPSFAAVSGVTFHQPRQLVLGYDGADWTSGYDGTKKAMIWAPPAAPAKTDAELAAMVPPLVAGTVLKPNTLGWGTMYSYSFTCDLSPRSDVSVKMELGTAGSFEGPMLAEARGPRHPADLGKQGGLAGDDGVLDNNDFVIFIDHFFNNDMRADLGVQGGGFGHDGALDNNDFVAFINYFFAS